jgi:hypothetical protein
MMHRTVGKIVRNQQTVDVISDSLHVAICAQFRRATFGLRSLVCSRNVGRQTVELHFVRQGWVQSQYVIFLKVSVAETRAGYPVSCIG